MKPKKILFVAGAPRSGTTAMVDLLNSHRQVIVLKERYFNLVLQEKSLTPGHFAEERMFSFDPGDSFYNAVAPETGQDRLKGRYEQAVYVGDKIPRLYERLDYISYRFDAVTLVFMSRNVFDVAASYNRRARDNDDKLWPGEQDFRAAVRDWNFSHRAVLNAVREYPNIDVIGVDYESVFFNKPSYERLLNRLDLSLNLNQEKLASVYQGAARLEAERGDTLTSAEKRYLCMRADLEVYRELRVTYEWIT